MTLKIGNKITEEEMVCFINESIRIYGIKQIKVVKSIISNEINIQTKNRIQCENILDKIDKVSHLEILKGGISDTVIVLLHIISL